MTQSLVQSIGVLFPLIFTSNLLMSAVKYFADRSMGRPGLRGVLAAISIVGALTASALTGGGVDFNLISEWAKLALEALVIGFGSHASYKVIKNA